MTRLSFCCPQNIQTMGATPNGKHCELCQKNIVDFTSFSPNQVQDYLHKNPDTNCGIFKPSQVTQPIQSNVSTLFKMAFGLVFMLGFNSTNLFAQADTIAIPVTNPESILINGTIISGGVPVVFAKIILYSDNQILCVTMSDFDGRYQLNLDAQFAREDLTLVVRCIGYQETHILLGPLDPGQTTVNVSPVEANEDDFLTGLIIITQPPLLSKDPYDFGKTTFTGDDIRTRQP